MKITLAYKQKDYFEVMRIRMEVFMYEQNIEPNIELDNLDDTAVHFLIYNESNKGIACCRLVYVDNHYKIGRLAVLKKYRRQGLATMLIHAVEEYAINQKIDELYLNAQLSALEVYKKSGYQPYGEVFVEADIDHIAMVKKL